MYKLNRLIELLRDWVINIDPRRFQVEAYAGSDLSPLPDSPRICIYGHYDPRGKVHEYVYTALKALKQNGLSTLFLTTSPSLAPGDIARLHEVCWFVGKRKNLGLDIGGWPSGMKLVELALRKQNKKCSQLVITNDSIFGPLSPLSEVFAQMSGQSLDIWGITDSQQIKHHIQSYFLVFENNGIDFFSNWVQDFKFSRDRIALIEKHEVGLSQAALSFGLKMGAYIPYEKFTTYAQTHSEQVEKTIHDRLSAKNGALNPTHAFWRESIKIFHSPFVKRDLLRDYSQFDDGGQEWPTVLASLVCDYPMACITEYLDDYHGRSLSKPEKDALAQKYSSPPPNNRQKPPSADSTR